MADGAIGYLENDEENKKIFRIISGMLKSGGWHVMDIMNGSYARKHFPCKLWEAGEKSLTLSVFEWEKDTKTLIYGQADYSYGKLLTKPEITKGNPIRLYTLGEVKAILHSVGMKVCNSYADFRGTPSSDQAIQQVIFSRKL